jgi:hypothetical protein
MAAGVLIYQYESAHKLFGGSRSIIINGKLECPQDSGERSQLG